MPKISDNMENLSLPGSNYVYTMTPKDKLTSAEYTLVSITVDVSGSVQSFKQELEDCLKQMVDACKLSPRADNLLLRIVKFGKTSVEHHGFKLLSEINLDDYNNFYNSYNGIRTTSLYDSNVDCLDALADSGKKLTDDDYLVNVIHVCITDGVDFDGSTYSAKDVGVKQENLTKGEIVESAISILVKVNVTDSHCSDQLNKFQIDGKFTQIVDAGNANSKNLAKLASFISKSVSSQSKALGSGTASKALTF